MLYVGAWYGACFLLSGSHVAVIFSSGGSTTGVAISQPYGVYPWQAFVPLDVGLWPIPVVHRVTAPSTTLGRRSSLVFIQLSLPAIPAI